MNDEMERNAKTAGTMKGNLSKQHPESQHRRGLIVGLFLIMLVTLSFAGCLGPVKHTEAYDDVYGEVISQGRDGRNITYEIEVMSLIGSYREKDGDHMLKNGEWIKLVQDPQVVPNDPVEKGSYIKVDIQRTYEGDPDEGIPFVITDMEEIGHPFRAIYHFLFGMVILGIAGIAIFVWIRSLDQEQVAEKLYNTYYGEVSCPSCGGDADILIQLRKFLPFEVKMRAACEECEYEIPLPTYVQLRKPLWGTSSDQVYQYHIVFATIAIFVGIVGTVFLGQLFINSFLNWGYYFEDAGRFILGVMALAVSILIIAVVYSLMKTELVRNLNEEGIQRSIRTGTLSRNKNAGDGLPAKTGQ